MQVIQFLAVVKHALAKQKDKLNSIYMFHLYRTINTLVFGYENQSLSAVQ